MIRAREAASMPERLIELTKGYGFRAMTTKCESSIISRESRMPGRVLLPFSHWLREIVQFRRRFLKA